MAKKQTKLVRIKDFLKLNIRCFILGLSPSRILGRYDGPKILVNSHPKAGTNLIERLLINTPRLRRKLGRMLMLWDVENIEAACNKLKSIKAGQFLSSHMVYDEKIFETMKQENIKGIMVIRDVRSKIISHFKYVTYMDVTHKTHNFFRSLNGDEERINAIIDGVPNIVASIDEELDRYSGWLNNPEILVIKFEDLVGEKGGGSKIKQQIALEKIISFLNIPISKEQILIIKSQIFSKNVRTFRSGKINQWDKYLNESQKNKIKTKAGQWLIDNGYEKDHAW